MNIENKYQKYIDFLYEKNCHKIGHFHSNFLDHFIGTFNILKKWRQPENLCVAGMFHNIYGNLYSISKNEYFNPNLNVNREEIKNLIGEAAEEIVFRYVNSDKDTINDSNDSELIILNLANRLEHERLFIVEDDLYDADASKIISDYFKNLNWTYDSKNLTDNSLKWNYNPNFKSIIEKNYLDISERLLKKYGLNKVFKLSRAYASGNTYGFSGEYHVDDGAKEYNEIITIMFYLNNNWDFHFGGETFFLNHERKEIQYAIIPKPGRAVIFDGFIYHGPRPLSKFCNELRMVLTFKYDLINR